MPVNADTACTFAGPVAEDFGPVKVQNISLEGIGLLVSRKVEVGMLLAVSLVNKTKSFSRTMLVRVVHVTPARGSYLIGGTFETPLTYQEFTSVVM
jgi:hypothetical protein